MSQRYRINEPYTIWQRYDNEVIMLNFRNGHYYWLNDHAGRILEIIHAGKLSDMLFHELPHESQKPASAILAFLNTLLDEEIICIEEQNLPIIEDNQACYDDYHPLMDLQPQLRAFSDMVHVLKLNDIYNVGPKAWPVCHG